MLSSEGGKKEKEEEQGRKRREEREERREKGRKGEKKGRKRREKEGKGGYEDTVGGSVGRLFFQSPEVCQKLGRQPEFFVNRGLYHGDRPSSW